MNMQTEVKTADNGVNVEAILDAREAIREMPAAVQFTWRANCEWIEGVQSHLTVEGFFGLGEEKMHKQPFTFTADHPAEFAATDNGATPVEILLSTLVSCLTAGIAAVVAQPQKRSAVFEIITNPGNVNVSVA